MARNASKKYVMAIVGATGVVGREMTELLTSREFPINELRLVASDRSQGQTIEFQGKDLEIHKLTPKVFEGVDLAFFTAGGGVSREFVPIATGAGALVVDNTSAFRMEKDVPLVVPEVNGEALAKLPSRRIASVPNCATVQLVVAVAPLHRKVKVRRIVLSTYQSTSGAGRKAMTELSTQVGDLFNYRETAAEVFPRRIAFNVIPQIDKFMDDGMTNEEAKIVNETRKILGDTSIGVSATAVRVPTFHGHAVSANLEFDGPMSVEDATKILMEAPGVAVVDDPKEGEYPTPAEAVGHDDVFVGRIRNDPSRANCLNLWIVADNLRKGAALNGIQIFETLIANGLL